MNQLQITATSAGHLSIIRTDPPVIELLLYNILCHRMIFTKIMR